MAPRLLSWISRGGYSLPAGGRCACCHGPRAGVARLRVAPCNDPGSVSWCTSLCTGRGSFQGRLSLRSAEGLSRAPAPAETRGPRRSVRERHRGDTQLETLGILRVGRAEL